MTCTLVVGLETRLCLHYRITRVLITFDPQAEREEKLKEERMKIGIEKLKLAHKKRVAIKVWSCGCGVVGVGYGGGSRARARGQP